VLRIVSDVLSVKGTIAILAEAKSGRRYNRLGFRQKQESGLEFTNTAPATST